VNPAALAGTGRLIRLVVRRDRVRLTIWVVVLVVLMAYSAVQVRDLYRTPESLAGYASTVSDNPALVVFAGPGYGLADAPTVGAVLVNETSLWMALGCALMSVFLVVRHSRAEEELERADLLRSLVVGRHAPLAAVLVVAVVADALVVAGSALCTIAAGFPVAGTLALTVSFGAVGVCFAGIAAVAAQLVTTARGALGLATGTAGFAFLLRGLGDISLHALSWLSPFGMAIGVRAFAGHRWWTPVGVLIGAALAVAVAVSLSVRRDLGSGLVAQRPGPATARRWITGPLGLSVRLQRAALLSWTAGVFVVAAVYGSVGDEIEAMLADNPQLADYLARLQGAGLTDAFLATALHMLALLACGYAVSSMLRVRTEEGAGFAESMLATPLPRWWWMGSHVAVTVAGTTVIVATSAFGVGLGYAWAVGDAAEIGRLFGAGLALLAPVLLVAAIVAFVVGWLPRFAVLSWILLGMVVVIGLFAQVLRLPGWVRDLSPLEHVAALPGRSWPAVPTVVLSGLCLVAFGAGVVGFCRRDLAGV